MAICQLIYYSTATTLLCEEQLAGIVKQARAFNGSHAITGILFYAGEQQLLQVLEGEDNAVQELYGRICQDRRHTNVTTVLYETTARRLFPGSTMNFGRVAPDALARLVSYLDPTHRAALLPSHCNAQDVITDLLHEFMEEQVARQ